SQHRRDVRILRQPGQGGRRRSSGDGRNLRPDGTGDRTERPELRAGGIQGARQLPRQRMSALQGRDADYEILTTVTVKAELAELIKHCTSSASVLLQSPKPIAA